MLKRLPALAGVLCALALWADVSGNCPGCGGMVMREEPQGPPKKPAPSAPAGYNVERRKLVEERTEDIVPVGNLADNIAFTPDLRHHAYAILSQENEEGDRGYLLMIDGKQLNEKAITSSSTLSSLQVSADGSKVYCLPTIGESDNCKSLLVNGQSGPEFDSIDDFKTTPGGLGYSYIGHKDDKTLVVFNGQPGPEFDAIQDVRISPDGKHVGYIASKDDKWRAYLDNKLKFKDGLEDPSCIAISPDCRRVAYTDTVKGKTVLHVDAKPVGIIEGDVSRIYFSPDSRHVTVHATTAPAATQPASGPTSRAASLFSREPQASAPQTKRSGVAPLPVATPAPAGTATTENAAGDGEADLYQPTSQPAEQTLVYVDGRQVGLCDQVIDDVFFSPDDRHFAFSGQTGEKVRVYLDGRAGTEYDELIAQAADAEAGTSGNLLFTNEHLLYVARQGEKYMLVIDGKEQPAWDRIFPGSLALSPDGKRVAYVAAKGNKQMVVLDGKPGPAYTPPPPPEAPPVEPAMPAMDGLGDGGGDVPLPVPVMPTVVVPPATPAADEPTAIITDITFSPDGRHVAYVVRLSEENCFVVLDGKPSPDQLSVGTLAFSPDGKHLAYAATDGDGYPVVMFDGTAGQQFDGIVQGPIFDPDGTMRYIASEQLTVTVMGDPSGESDGEVSMEEELRTVYYMVTLTPVQAAPAEAASRPAATSQAATASSPTTASRPATSANAPAAATTRPAVTRSSIYNSGEVTVTGHGEGHSEIRTISDGAIEPGAVWKPIIKLGG